MLPPLSAPWSSVSDGGRKDRAYAVVNQASGVPLWGHLIACRDLRVSTSVGAPFSPAPSTIEVSRPSILTC